MGKSEMSKGTIVLTLGIPDRSGSPRMTLAYGKRLIADGYAVVLLHGSRHATGENSFIPTFEANGIRCQTVRAIDLPVGPLAVRSMCRAISAHAPVAVVSCQVKDSALAMRAARRLGLPRVHFVQNKRIFSGPLPLARFKKFNYIQAMRHTGCHLIINSPSVITQHTEDFGIARDRITFVANGIDIEGLRTALVPRAKAREALGLEASDIVMMQMGRISPQKGQDIGIEGFARFLQDDAPEAKRSRYKLLFWGLPGAIAEEQAFDRDQKARITALGLEDNIRFMGWVDQVTDVIGAADMMLHPARWEGSPLAVLEGLALGLPVAFSDCVGTPEGFVTGQDGFVFAMDDPEACRAVLKTALIGRSAEALQQIGTRGRSLCGGTLRRQCLLSGLPHGSRSRDGRAMSMSLVNNPLAGAPGLGPERTITVWEFGLILSCLAMVKSVAGVSVYLNALMLIVAALQIYIGRLSIFALPFLAVATIAGLGLLARGGTPYQAAQMTFLFLTPLFMTFIGDRPRSVITNYMANWCLPIFFLLILLEVASGGTGRTRSLASVVSIIPGVDLAPLSAIRLTRFSGPSGDPNFSGMVAALMALLFFIDGRKWALVGAITCLLLMVSRGGVLALIFAMIILGSPLIIGRLLAVISYLILMGLPITVHFLHIFLSPTAQVELVIKSSKRFLHWIHYLEFGLDNPLLGIGYFKGKTYYAATVTDFTVGGTNFARGGGRRSAQEAHNFTLDLWGELGIVAWGFVCLFLLLILRHTWHSRSGLAIFGLLMTGYLFLAGLSDWAFWFGLGCILSCVASDRKNAARNQPRNWPGKTHKA